MPTFPLPFVPAQSYKTGGRRFGAQRDGGARQHAACDLIAPEGTEVYAVDEGTVLNAYLFYHGTWAVEVRHPLFVVRYGEVQRPGPGIARGASVSAGQVVAYVGKMHVDAMLHFEMYSGSVAGNLTQRSNPPFERRSDLLDPTPYLDQWQGSLRPRRE